MTLSASKIVFVIMALALCFFTYIKLVDPKDFMAVALMVFTFYFANKGDVSLPYAGK
jgi:hypothetical protein